MDSINAVFVPVFDKHNVDLAMSGHDHTWARTHALNDNKQVSEATTKATEHYFGKE